MNYNAQVFPNFASILFRPNWILLVSHNLSQTPFSFCFVYFRYASMAASHDIPKVYDMTDMYPCGFHFAVPLEVLR